MAAASPFSGIASRHAAGHSGGMNESPDRAPTADLPDAVRRCAGLTSLLCSPLPRDAQPACADEATDWFESLMAQLDAQPPGAAH